MPHRVDLGPRLRRSFRKEISLGDCVRPVGLGMNANYLAAKVVRVAGGLLRVPRHVPWPFVDGSVARGERIRVVAGGDVEVALGVEGHRAAGVTALQALRSHLEQNFPGAEVERVAFHVEASDDVFRFGAGGRVVHVDPAVRREMRIGRKSEQAVLRLTAIRVFRADGNRRDPFHVAGLRRIQVDVAMSLDEQHAIAGKHGELDGLVQLFGQNDSGEPILFRQAVGGFANVGVAGMANAPGARESAVPWPAVLGVGGGMNSNVSATGLDVALEIVLLCVVQYVAGCVEPDHCAVPREVLRRESAGVFGRVDGESVFHSELFDGGDPDSDGTVSEPGGFGEDEYARLLGACGNGYAERSEKKRERDESMHLRSRRWGDGRRTATRQFAPPYQRAKNEALALW